MAKQSNRNAPRHIPVVKEGGSQSQPRPSPSGLDTIFVRGGQPPTRLERMKRRRIKPIWWVIGTLALLAVAAVIGFFALGDRQFRGDQVRLTLTADQEVASGDIITLTIEYDNAEKVPLGNASLITRFPEGFTVQQTSAEPANSAGNSWDVGTIRPGQGGSLTITGQLTGEVGATKTFAATLVYKPADFNATFETISELTVTIAQSIIELTLTGPTRVAPNVTANYSLAYTSTSEAVLENVTIEPQWPSTFSLTASEPTLSDERDWSIARLTKSEGGQITFSGTFTGEVGDTVELIFVVSRVTADGFSEKQLTYRQLVLLVGGDLSLDLTVNGTAENIIVEHDSILEYQLTYTNTTEFVLANISFSLAFDEVVLAYDQLIASGTGRREGKKITWDSATTPALAGLKPNDSGTFTVSVPIRGNLNIDTSQDVNFSVVATSSGAIGEVKDGAGLQISVPTTTREAKIASLLVLAAEARYYAEDGTKLGSGPLPPEVGKTTVYRVLWSLTNNSNDVSGVTITTTLPKNVSWKGNQSVTAGSLSYNKESKTVTWSINEIPAGSGYYLNTLIAVFDIALTPTSADVGTTPLLTDVNTAEGTDSYTSTERTSTASRLTTELTNDTFAQGKGKVVE